MQTDERWHHLLSTFGSELEDHVRGMNQLLLRLERGEEDGKDRLDTLDALFREAHSLKGAARAMELADVERLAHAIESALGTMRRTDTTPSPQWFDAVYRAVDAFAPLQRHALMQQDSLPPDLPEILAALADDVSATEPPPDAIRQGNPGPTQPPPPNGTSDAILLGGMLPTARSEIMATTNGAALIGEPPQTVQPETVAPTNVAAHTEPASVRVAVEKLDALLAQAGELAVAEIRIQERLREIRQLQTSVAEWRRDWRRLQSLGSIDKIDAPSPSGSPLGVRVGALLDFQEKAGPRLGGIAQSIERIASSLGRDTTQLNLVTRAIGNEVMEIRLVPIASIFAPFERMVRDLTRTTGKRARVVLHGGDTEIDRRILEAIGNPLMHMIRNAVDHGIEEPAIREAHDKPATGRIEISVDHRGSSIEIVVTDDGAGLDPVRLRATAVKRGLVTKEQAQSLDDTEALQLLFLPGFTTSPVVTATSGRGVGTDVVRENVEQLGGSVDVQSELGQWTRFTLLVPLTLATTRAVLVEAGNQLLAVPSATIERNARALSGAVVSIEGRRVLEFEGRPVAVLDLAGLLETRNGAGRSIADDDWLPLFVLRQGERRLAFTVDRLVGEQEIVIKGLAWPLRRVRNVAGAAVLSSGEVAIILNPSDLFKAGLQQVASTAGTVRVEVQEGQVRTKKRILVVDDSVTTRTLERSIIEAAGYEVSTASDGAEAFDLLRVQQFDLVVSDVDMPLLDGFALTAKIRQDERLRETPVVLITSLESPEHKQRGMEVGADAYIVKRTFDQIQLLETIGRLL